MIIENKLIKLAIITLILATIVSGLVVVFKIRSKKSNLPKTTINMNQENEILLPEPQRQSKTTIEEAILKRRSSREFKDEPLTLFEISQILWSAQGITAPEWGGRAAPSAGALYPLEIYLVARKAEGLLSGVYHFIPQGHKLRKVSEGDLSLELTTAALGQDPIKAAPVNLVITAIFERTTQKYGERGIHYVYMEAGHAAQNVYLQTQSLNLGTVTIGAFDDEEVKKLLKLSPNEVPLYIMPIGYRK